jgi:hypothetical protein
VISAAGKPHSPITIRAQLEKVMAMAGGMHVCVCVLEGSKSSYFTAFLSLPLSVLFRCSGRNWGSKPDLITSYQVGTVVQAPHEEPHK